MLPWLFVTIIVIVFFHYAWKYLLALRRASRALANATGHVSGNPEKDTPPKVFPAGPERLRELWSEFLRERAATTIDHDGRQVSTVDPAEIFHDEAIFGAYNRNFAITLAGFFTGLGILGTFVGLVYGLSSVDTSSLDSTGSVDRLLGGMSTAFISSLAGITASLAWLFFDRWLFDAVQRGANDFFRRVRARYPVENADRLLHHLLQVEQDENQAIQASKAILLDVREIQLQQRELQQEQRDIQLERREIQQEQRDIQLERREVQKEQRDIQREQMDAQREQMDIQQEQRNIQKEIRDVQQEQKGILQSLDSDLAIAFEGAMTRSFETSLVPRLEEMTGVMSDLSVQFGAQQADALEDMVKSFQDNLTEHLHGHLKGLTEGIENAAKWQEAVHEQSLELTERLTAATGQQIDLLDAVTKASERFTESIAGLTEVHGQIRDAAGLIESASAGIGDMADAITKQASGLAEQIELLGTEQGVFREANKELQVQLAQQLDTLDGRMREAGSIWNGLSEELEEVGKRLQAGATEFSTLTTQKLHEIFARFDSEMALVTKHLSGTIAEVRDVTEDLPRHIGDLTEAMQKHASGLTQANGVGLELSERMEGLSEVALAIERVHPLGRSISDAAIQLERASIALQNVASPAAPPAIDGSTPT